MRVDNILEGHELFTVEKQQSVCEVAKRMATLNVGAILVVDQGELCGIFSERDLMTRVVVPGLSLDTTAVGSVMTTHVTTIEASASLSEAMELMHRHKCRHLPVMRDGQVSGMVSMRHLMDIELETRTEELKQIRHYIHEVG